MIYSVKGILAEKLPATAVIDTGSVAYEISISAATYRTLPSIGEKAGLFTHFVMREDAVALYGFATIEEKKLFLLLNTISKIGPKIALAILSAMEAKKFMNAVVQNDITLIATIPGIGRKSAERIIVELKDKFGQLAVQSEGSQAAGGTEDLVSALSNLGYSANDCRKAVTKIYKPGTPFEELFRLALKELSQ
ncbi:Holliday junction branch migration protein RuvA [Seleniivibrio woodruffii]|uniref:Holliday junction branch migration complex subunit RuvA n=1 Tax=Seleniivibrio woodruffii TaxID=1078050 RepID=A0A4R1KCM9_9BACT|nr:Holliday junction branch migration protein RuvA [Seleniivibrio woodruffii]TCK62282.1 Holliday junction DNA helicase subunit RuvA [Seleniivibrio woodruffii]TVZ34600.1 Holliday junction DNA helicase subunit RuvA [Seleniivibrio woodruffii]